MNIVFDLDGTLADIVHRLHYIQDPKKDWDAFFEACDMDGPIESTIALFRALRRPVSSPDHYVEIWSGRREAEGIREKTLNWLRTHVSLGFMDEQPTGFFTTRDQVYVRMRQHDDFRSDVAVKQEWLIQAIEAGKAPDFVIDDRQRVVDMWRRNGIRCFQCAPGNY